ncbi:MAG: PHP domain-containing protein, partial [Victivallales bacterium]|nr:PHP domain-containing protein [Victivallales bacterium]
TIENTAMTINYYGKTFNVYKAALHTHSTTSPDALFPPQELIRLYKEQGYQVLAFTDHRATNDVSRLDAMGMTLISGMEVHPMGPRGKIWHIVALNVPADFPHPDPSRPVQEAIDKVIAAGGICIYPHPYWSGNTIDEIASLKHLSGIEVYNSATRDIGREYGMAQWDDLSERGLLYSATAVDDVHHVWDLFRGWTNILAENSDLPSIMEALRAGRFYASQGPSFKRLSYENGVFEAEFTSCVSVICVSSPRAGAAVTFPDQQGPGTGTREITSCSIPIQFENSPSWFRLQIRDAEGRYAWSNPIRV